MPPKRKSSLSKKENVSEEKSARLDSFSTAKTALQKQPSMRKKSHKPDAHCSLSDVEVVDDYDCMLNQTNIGNNNNKFYVIQVLKIKNKSIWHTFTRWGRVGESGTTSNLGPYKNQEQAISEFEKKFQDKTRNKWANRALFKPAPGKYTLLEMGEENEEEQKEDKAKDLSMEHSVKCEEFAPSKLPIQTQKLVNLIFNQDMFMHAMEDLELDVKKMPLGKLSMPQIQKGFTVLENLKNVIDGNTTGDLSELSSTFYTIIPHSFGRTCPPVISTAQHVQKKFDMLLVLADIVEAQKMEKKSATTDNQKKKIKELPENPLDTKYQELDCDLTLVSSDAPEYKLINEYMTNTKGTWSKFRLVNIWKVDRKSAATNFKQYDTLSNRKLLWHGTNIAVVAAILKSGLRIMPHSGGRVGRGIYFASENAMSAYFVRCSRDKYGVMFLNEVALGKSKLIYQDDCNLIEAPNGFNSVLAKGTTEPDPEQNDEIIIEDKPVIVPKGKPINESFQSCFTYSEYLIYKEAQCRIRYILLLKSAY